MTPKFDADSTDSTTFAPFILLDCRASEWKDLRLVFSDWGWLQERCGGDTLDGYYLNGYGVEGLVMATRQLNGLDPESSTMDRNSEGDTCFIHFSDFAEAVRTAEICATMIRNMELLRKAIATAKEHGYGD